MPTRELTRNENARKANFFRVELVQPASIVSAKTYEIMLESVENIELLELAKTRLKEKDKAVRIKLEDL